MPIDLVCRVFANTRETEVPSQFKSTQKMVLDTYLLNSQLFQVRIKGKVRAILGQEKRPSLHLDVVDIEKWAFGSPHTNFTNFTLYIHRTTRLFSLSKATSLGERKYSNQTFCKSGIRQVIPGQGTLHESSSHNQTF